MGIIYLSLLQKLKKEIVMRKFLTLCLWVLCAAVIFFAGFYIGSIDADAHEIKITSQCSGIGMEKSFSANYERIGDEVVKDEKTNSEKYTTRCLCFASDATHENIWVDTVELSGQSEEDVINTCNSDCQALCESRLNGFSFIE